MKTLTMFSPSRTSRMLLATLAVAVVGSLSQVALASPHGGAGAHRGHGMEGHGMAGHAMAGGGMGMGMMGGPRQIERMLDAVNATPEQRSQIQQILQNARTDMGAQREAGRKMHEQGAALFAQPTVDARAAEALRQQMLAQHEQASKRGLQVMLDVSRVLTPEQRKALAERMAERRTMMERHRAEHAAAERAPR